FFFQAEDGIRDFHVTGVQTCALPISETRVAWEGARRAALAVGLVESEYFPMLAISVLGGYQNTAVPVPTSVASDGFFRLELLQRSEERRVGKECRYRCSPERQREKEE